jgi:hypothetical protein
MKFENRPPLLRFPTGELPRIVDLKTYEQVHLWADALIKEYLEWPRSNYGTTATREAELELRKSASPALYAVNAYSRIRFARTVVEHAANSGPLSTQRSFFVTIVPGRFTFPVGDEGAAEPKEQAIIRRIGPAARFDVRRIQALARQALQEIAFVGVVEAALYRSWSSSGPSKEDHVSWHCHLLAWNTTKADLTRALAPLRAREKSLLRNSSVAHVQKASEVTPLREIPYMLKAPQKIYRVNLFGDDYSDSQAGLCRPTVYRQQKRPLLTRDRVRMLDVMAGRTLDHLLFGNREGTALANAIRREALSSFRDLERRGLLQSLHSV